VLKHPLDLPWTVPTRAVYELRSRSQNWFSDVFWGSRVPASYLLGRI